MDGGVAPSALLGTGHWTLDIGQWFCWGPCSVSYDSTVPSCLGLDLSIGKWYRGAMYNRRLAKWAVFWLEISNSRRDVDPVGLSAELLDCFLRSAMVQTDRDHIITLRIIELYFYMRSRHRVQPHRTPWHRVLH